MASFSVCLLRITTNIREKNDGEALGGRRLARTPPRRVTRSLVASTIAAPAPEAIEVLSSAGDGSRPHHVFRPQNRGVVIQALPAAS